MTTRAAALLALVALMCTACSSAAPAPAPTTIGVSPTTAVEQSTTTTEPPGVAPSGLRTRTQGVLTIGTERLSPPWYIGPRVDLLSGGFEYDIAAELARRLGVPAVKVVPTALVLMMGGQDCKCDIMLSGITITDARARTVDLSEPYLSADQGVLVRKGTSVTTPSEAATLRWELPLANAAGLDLLQSHIKPTIEPHTAVNADEAVLRLQQGRVDAVLLDTPEAVAVANATPGLAVAGQYKTGEQYSVALPLGSPNTALINDTVRDLRDDGTIATLLRAYFGIDPGKLPTLSS